MPERVLATNLDVEVEEDEDSRDSETEDDEASSHSKVSVNVNELPDPDSNDTPPPPPRKRTVAPVAAAVKTQRINNKDTPQVQKRKVHRATKRICLIERVSSASVIKYCYIIPKKEDDAVLDRLEYSWGMQRGTLNVFSRFNICILGAKLQHLFDFKNLLFLPTREVIEEYVYHKITTTPLPHEPDRSNAQPPTFDYHLVAPPCMAPVGILRRKVGEDEQTRTDTKPEHFEIHTYPYETLPIIKSHVLPHFVIYNAGKKLERMGGEEFLDIRRKNDHIHDLAGMLLSVMALYRSWIRIKPTPEWMQDLPPPNPPASQHSSQAPTEPRMLKGQGSSPTTGKSKRKRDQGDTGEGGQQKRGKGQQSGDNLNGSTLLDTRSIKKLDARSDPQIYSEKKVSIDKWRVSVDVKGDLEPPNEGDHIMEGMC